MEKYEILRTIGKGSHGDVYLIRRREDDIEFVLKRIPVGSMSSAESAATFQEVKLLSSLRHPNIVAYIESFMDGQGDSSVTISHKENLQLDSNLPGFSSNLPGFSSNLAEDAHIIAEKQGVLCIVMEYCAGGDLFSRIQKQRQLDKPFPEKQVVEWLAQLASAIHLIHQNKILHRDLKTQNIFLDHNNCLKLGDFGIARTLENTREMARTLVGTPYYMSPELFEGKPYNFKSDLWALGCCVYEMCSLKHAFDAREMSTLVIRVLRGVPPAIPGTFSVPLQELVKNLLCKFPNKRPSTSHILSLQFVRKYVPNNSVANSSVANSSVTKPGTAAVTTPSTPSKKTRSFIRSMSEKREIGNKRGVPTPSTPSPASTPTTPATPVLASDLGQPHPKDSPTVLSPLSQALEHGSSKLDRNKASTTKKIVLHHHHNSQHHNTSRNSLAPKLNNGPVKQVQAQQKPVRRHSAQHQPAHQLSLLHFRRQQQSSMQSQSQSQPQQQPQQQQQPQEEQQQLQSPSQSHSQQLQQQLPQMELQTPVLPSLLELLDHTGNVRDDIKLSEEVEEKQEKKDEEEEEGEQNSGEVEEMEEEEEEEEEDEENEEEEEEEENVAGGSTEGPQLRGSLSQRIEILTQLCLPKLGHEKLEEIKKYMREHSNWEDLEEAAEKEAGNSRILQNMFGDTDLYVEFAPIITQILFCEEALS